MMKSILFVFMLSLMTQTLMAQDGWSTKYVQLGFNSTKLKSGSDDFSIKSKFGANLSSGRTFFFNSDPVANVLKFGLDWTWADVHYSKFTENDGLDEITLHKADLGMQVGPSVTYMPADNVKVRGYVRYAPSYSLLYDNYDEEASSGFGNYFVPGLSVSYGAIGLGLEYRSGSAKHSFLSIDEFNFEEDEEIYIQQSEKVKMLSSGVRFFISFSF